ncbi:MAG: hypothetical protein AB1489_32645 [Acidobacteriota bacterium]
MQRVLLNLLLVIALSSIAIAQTIGRKAVPSTGQEQELINLPKQ